MTERYLGMCYLCEQDVFGDFQPGRMSQEDLRGNCRSVVEAQYISMTDYEISSLKLGTYSFGIQHTAMNNNSKVNSPIDLTFVLLTEQG